MNLKSRFAQDQIGLDPTFSHGLLIADYLEKFMAAVKLDAF